MPIKINCAIIKRIIILYKLQLFHSSERLINYKLPKILFNGETFCSTKFYRLILYFVNYLLIMKIMKIIKVEEKSYMNIISKKIN